MKARFFCALLLVVGGNGYASELVYRPVNPNFGGNPLGGNYLLGVAQAQNDKKDPNARSSAFSQMSALDRFTSSLESRLLSQLLGDIEEGSPGRMETSDFIVDILDEDGMLSIQITDKATDELTEIEVSGLNANN